MTTRVEQRQRPGPERTGEDRAVVELFGEVEGQLGPVKDLVKTRPEVVPVGDRLGQVRPHVETARVAQLFVGPQRHRHRLRPTIVEREGVGEFGRRESDRVVISHESILLNRAFESSDRSGVVRAHQHHLRREFERLGSTRTRRRHLDGLLEEVLGLLGRAERHRTFAGADQPLTGALDNLVTLGAFGSDAMRRGVVRRDDDRQLLVVE